VNYSEDDLVPLSYLSQYYYCPRRAGFLLIERTWSDNIHTMEGSIVHKRVNDASKETRPDLVRLTSLPLHSLRLGLFGIADSIELYATPDGYTIQGLEGRWEIVPVEYKHGRVRNELEYEIQLCAQAMCIEEMLSVSSTRGFVYYAGDRRRKEVRFTPELRHLVEKGAESLHILLSSGVTPPVVKSKKCQECSLLEDCLPQLKPSSTSSYIKRLWDIVESKEEQ